MMRANSAHTADKQDHSSGNSEKERMPAKQLQTFLRQLEPIVLPCRRGVNATVRRRCPRHGRGSRQLLRGHTAHHLAPVEAKRRKIQACVDAVPDAAAEITA